MQEIEIISEPSEKAPFLVINKPSGLPSAPLNANDTENAFYKAAARFPEVLQVKGRKEIEHGLLHRLDTVTGGLILIAATQEFYDSIQKQQEEGEFIKYYTALCSYNPENPKFLDNFPPLKFTLDEKLPFTLTSYFRGFGKGQKEVRPVTQNSNKAALQKIGKPELYSTQIIKIEKKGSNYETECKITKGYRHQVRCHLAWAGLPIINDSLYNCMAKNTSNQIEFRATKIEFTNPLTDERVMIEL